MAVRLHIQVDYVRDVASDRSGWSYVRSLAEQFDAKPSAIRQLLRGDFDPGQSRELMDEMRAVGLPT